MRRIWHILFGHNWQPDLVSHGKGIVSCFDCFITKFPDGRIVEWKYE